VICLQETHVDTDIASHFSIEGFDLVSHQLHAKHGWGTYVRTNITDVTHESSGTHWDVIKVGITAIANMYKTPSEPWSADNPLPVLSHPPCYLCGRLQQPLSWLGLPKFRRGRRDTVQLGILRRPYRHTWSQAEGHVSLGPMAARLLARSLLGHLRQRPPATSYTHHAWWLPVQSALTMFHLCRSHSTSHPMLGQEALEFQKSQLERIHWENKSSIPTIPRPGIFIESRGGLSKAAHATIPRVVRHLYIPCIEKESAELLKQYEESGEPDVTDHLIELLNAAWRTRWDEATSQMNFTRSSRKSWALMHQLGAAQRPAKASRLLSRLTLCHDT